MRFVLKFIICCLLAAAAGTALLAMRSGDTVYTLHELISPGRFQQYDGLIRNVATHHQMDPMLVKAIVWRESKFDPQKYGTAGERGLMQVSERAASEWARENRIENFRAEELFDPKNNLEAGTWYLARAMTHWKNQADPVPFALAEYNAGASRAQRWAGGNDETVMSPDDFRGNIEFPGTRKYVDSIMARYEFYKRRGRM
ncbi:MAG: lytic transglycosylase domain-containing protein [Chthoniobacterales bacterium]